jgi:3-oxocholest-4-en-26-oyl-CoA dehydrogenase beta subunit
MDFSFSDDQLALRDLARQILGERATVNRIKEIEAGTDWFDDSLWAELAKANLLGIAVPEEHGGLGYGIVEVALLLAEQGRAVAPLPLIPTLVYGAMPIAEFGTDQQRAAWLPGVADGSTILSAALVETGSRDPLQPSTTAQLTDGRWLLDGVKVCVPAAHLAQRILVPARTSPTSVGVFLVDPTADGVTIERQLTTRREPEARITFAGVVADDVLGDPDRGAAIVAWIVERALVALAATQMGVTEEALRMTAEYTKGRIQFDRPIATFQAVGQRAADAYIDVQAITLTMWQAAWRLSEGLPATDECIVAKFWAAEGAQRVVHAAQHLHGGMGVDVDYPLHRYFLWAKQLELTLGAGTPQLVHLGDRIAEQAKAAAGV